MATPPAQNVIDAIVASNTRVTRRVEIYESDGETPWDGIDEDISRVIDGAISVDGTRDERRTLDLTLENTDGSLRPSPRGFWYDKVIIPYRGIVTPTFSWEVAQGKFLIDNINEASFPHSVKVTARDFTKKLSLSKFIDSVTFVSGQVLEDVIKAIAGNAGVHDFKFPNEGIITGTDYSFDQGSDRWVAVKQMAMDYDYELFFDNDGFFVMREHLDPTTAPIQLTLKTGAPDGNLVSFEREVDDSNLFNHVLVIGGSADGTTVPPYAEAINTLPGSPTNVDSIGDRLFPYTSAGLSTNDQCKKLADSLLRVQALETYNMNTESIVFPWLDGNDIVEILDPDADPLDPTRYLFDTFTIPLTLTSMSGTAKRITVVGSGTA